MKYIIYALGFLQAVFLIACSDKNPGSEPYLSATDPARLEQELVSDSPGSYVEFESDRKWTAVLQNTTPEGDWIKLDVAEGTEGKNIVRFLLDKNTSTEPRSSWIVIKAGSKQLTARITQLAPEGGGNTSQPGVPPPDAKLIKTVRVEIMDQKEEISFSYDEIRRLNSMVWDSYDGSTLEDRLAIQLEWGEGIVKMNGEVEYSRAASGRSRAGLIPDGPALTIRPMSITTGLTGQVELDNSGRLISGEAVTRDRQSGLTETSLSWTAEYDDDGYLHRVGYEESEYTGESVTDTEHWYLTCYWEDGNQVKTGFQTLTSTAEYNEELINDPLINLDLNSILGMDDLYASIDHYYIFRYTDLYGPRSVNLLKSTLMAGYNLRLNYNFIQDEDGLVTGARITLAGTDIEVAIEYY